jgi:hypothetical protein
MPLAIADLILIDIAIVAVFLCYLQWTYDRLEWKCRLEGAREVMRKVQSGELVFPN